jgi:glucose-1-phosphate adenylyltransferase
MDEKTLLKKAAADHTEKSSSDDTSLLEAGIKKFGKQGYGLRSPGWSLSQDLYGELPSMNQVLTVLLAGGAGERLHPLTRHRAKPAVPFGGMYRIIDFTLSNCVNSDCRRVLVLVQYKSHSLARHIRRAWNIMHPELGEFIDVVPPQQRVDNNWYLGTANALFQNMYMIDQVSPREVLVLSGDHIYKMNYKKMINMHRKIEADLTISAIEVPIEEAHRFGILEVDTSGRVIGFEEKPEYPKPIPTDPHTALASMGVYAFNTPVLREELSKDAGRKSSHDFGKDIIPNMVAHHSVYAHKFEDENKKETVYWRDVGTLDSYWQANMDLVQVEPHFNLYDKSWPLYTNLPMLPPAKFVFASPGERFGVAMDSIVSPGCIISGGTVNRCILSQEVRVHSYSHVEQSILLDGVRIGRYARIRRTIIEKGVQVPNDSIIGYDLEEDAKRYRVTPEGIVVVEAANLPQAP